MRDVLTIRVSIKRAMRKKQNSVLALAVLAMAEPSEVVTAAYGGKECRFGPESILPAPFDPRLLTRLPCAVAQAAMDTRHCPEALRGYGNLSRKTFALYFQIRGADEALIGQGEIVPRRVIFSNGESDRVLQATMMGLLFQFC